MRLELEDRMQMQTASVSWAVGVQLLRMSHMCFALARCCGATLLVALRFWRLFPPLWIACTTRLFLSMDPVHGEISRAMRNRGLEIYISGDGDGSIPDDLDLKVLLHSLGLVGGSVCDTLLALHTEARSAVVGKVLDLQASAGFYSSGNSCRFTWLLIWEFLHLVYIEVEMT